MAYDDSNGLASHFALHGKEATCDEAGVLCFLGHVGIEVYVLYAEVARIVEHGAVDASLVRSFHVYILIAALLELGLRDECVQHA